MSTLNGLIDRMDRVESRLDNHIRHQREQMENIMSIVDALKQAVQNELDVDDQIVVYLEGLKVSLADVSQKLSDALAAGGDPAAIQGVIDTLTKHVADMTTHLPPTP